jgi:hypothetical protein
VDKALPTRSSAQLSQQAKLPSCCAVITDDSKPGAIWIDCWTATPSGDGLIDYACGSCHADEVLRYARETNQPNFVDCVITSLTLDLYTRRGFIEPLENLERGFMDRIRRDDPAAFDRMAMRIIAQYPQLRH